MADRKTRAATRENPSRSKVHQIVRLDINKSEFAIRQFRSECLVKLAG
jgi:hypothetical protein